MSLQIFFQNQAYILENPHLSNIEKLQEYVSKKFPVKLPKTWFFENPFNPNSQERYLEQDNYKILINAFEGSFDPISLKIVLPSGFEFQEFHHEEPSHVDSEESKQDLFRFEEESSPKSFKNDTFSEVSTIQDKSQIHLPEVPEVNFRELHERSSSKEEKIRNLEKQFQEELKKKDLQDIDRLRKEIEKKKRECQEYQDENRQTELEKTQRKLEELQNLEGVFLKIESLQQIIHEEDNLIQLSGLQSEFNDGLKHFCLEDIQELRKKIEKKKKECEEYQSENRLNKLEKAQLKLEKLQHLETLFGKIESLTQSCFCSFELDEPQKASNEDLKKEEAYNPTQMFNAEKQRRLESLSKRVESMPDCAVRSLLRLILYSEVAPIKEKIPSSFKVNIPDDLEGEITKTLAEFKKRLDFEGNNNAKINKTYDDIDLQSLESLQINLNIIKRELMPFDIQEMLELVEGAEESLRIIKDKDICIFIGGSGAGKSVTVHYVVGSEMVETKVNGRPHIEPINVTDPILRNVITSSASKSETKFITAVKVDLSKYGLESLQLWICDTPGALDTDGAEVDVANGFNLKKALLKCNSVRFAFFVSDRGLGDRCQEFKKIAQTFVEMIPDITTYSRSIAYFFTKFPDNKGEFIHENLKEILGSLTEAERFDNKLPKLLQDMIKKTRRSPIVVNPLDGKPEDILERISDLVELERPSDLFKVPLHPDSRNKLEVQALIDQKNIIAAAERSEYSLAKYWLDKLKAICDLLGLESLKRIYSECVTSLIKHLDKLYNSATTAISKCLSEGNKLSPKEIEDYEASIRNAELAEPLRNDLGDEAIGSSSYILFIKAQVDKILAAIDDKNLDDPLIRSTLDKIHLLRNRFGDLDTKYQDACEKVLQLFQTSIKASNTSFGNFEYEESGFTLTQVQKAISLYEKHIEKDKTQSQYQQAINSLVAQLKESVDDLEPIFAQTEIKGRDIDRIQTCLEKLEKIKDSSSLRTHISQSDIQKILNSLVDLAFNYYKKVEEKVTQLIENKKEKSLENVEPLIEQLVLLRRIPALENKTSDTYHNIFLILTTSLLALKSEAQNEAIKIFQDSQSSNAPKTYENLCKILVKLKSANWISKYKENIQIDIMDSIQEEIYEQFKNLRMYLADIPIDLDHSETLKEAYQKIRIFNQMTSLEKIFPGLTQARGEAISFFESRTSSFFSQLEGQIAGYNKIHELKYNAKKIDKIFAYCETAKEISELRSKSSDLLENLERAIQVCSSEVIQQMDKSLKQIIEYMENVSNMESPVKDQIIFNKSQGSQDAADDNHDDYLSCVSDNSSTKSKSIRRYISGKSESITRHLNTIYKIREYETIYKHFDPNQEILKSWEKKIQDLAVEVEDNLKLSLSNESHLDLCSFIEVTRGLSELDEFNLIGENEKFKKIAKTYYDLLLQDSNEKAKEVGNQIKNHKFEEVKKYLDDLAKRSNDILFGPRYKRLTFALSITVQDLRDQILKKAESILSKDSKDYFQEFHQDLIKHEKAKSTVASHIENEKVRENLENLKIEVKQRISKSFLTLFNKLLDSIENGGFLDELEDKVHSIKDICLNLDEYCDEQILEKLKSLERAERNKLRELEQKFSNMNIKSYSSFPPKFLLEKLASKTHERYRQLKEIIETQVKEALKNQLPKQDENHSLDIVQRQLRNLEYSLNFVPDNIKMEIQDELMGYRNKLDKKETELSIEFNDLVQNPEPRRYAFLITRCEEIREELTLSRVKNHLNQDISNIRKAVSDKLENKQIEDIKPDLVRFIELQTALAHLVSDFENHSNKLESIVLTPFRKEFNSFLMKFRYFENSIDVEMGLSNLKNLLAFGRLEIKLKNHLNSQHNILRKLSEQSTVLFSQVSQVMTENIILLKEEYNQALINFDFHILKNSLTLKERWEPLITLVRSVDEDFHQEFSSILEISTSFNFSKLLTDLKKALGDKSKTLQNLKLVNPHTKGFEQPCIAYFTQVSRDLKILSDATEFFTSQPKMEWSPSYPEVIQALQNQTKDLSNSARESLNRIFSSDTPTQEECEKLNLYSSILAIAEEQLQEFLNPHNTYFDEIQQHFQTKFLDFRNLICYEDVKQVAQKLIFMKTLASNIHRFSLEINAKINETLITFKSRQGGSSAIPKLGTELSKDATGAGQSILDECSMFKGYKLHRFNTLTCAHGINYVIDKLEGTDLEKDKLTSVYLAFDSLFQELIDTGLRQNRNLTEKATQIRLLVSGIKPQKPGNIKWDHYYTAKIPKVLAHLFALWTLQNAEHYYEANGQNDQESFLLKPHPAQVISILRLLGMGSTTQLLENNLIQINTGEGKSITLAIAAATLALFGFEVSCACYSDYLSKRDYDAFKGLFDLLDLTEFIHYGTYDELCEQKVNEKGQVRSLVGDFILNGPRNGASVSERVFRARILLCDEVDVFFGQKYHGGLYHPVACIQDPTIVYILDLIWQRRASINKSQVYASAEFQNCLNRFPYWEPFFRKQVQNLVCDVKSYPNHQYTVQNDQIGYRKNDTISFETVYGYQTLFAYYQECEKGNISRNTLDKKKSINVSCGSFSYTELPKEFSYIMGVTGTLKLSEVEKTIVKDEYKIQKTTIAPSVFGVNNLRFDKSRHVLIENKHEYHNAIFKEVQRQLRSDNGLRAVFVFFESADTLQSCLQSTAFDSIRDNIKCLTEEANPQEKNLIIKRATISGQITFFTNSFGRGTDFIVNDKNVSLNGGVHVIQTFFSEDVSEEEQIKGRTARQGESGSFSMILLDESLKKFFGHHQVDFERLKRGHEYYPTNQTHPDHDKRHETVYDLLAAKRDSFAHSQQEKRQSKVQNAKESHRKSIEFLNDVQNQNMDRVKDFIINNS